MKNLIKGFLVAAIVLAVAVPHGSAGKKDNKGKRYKNVIVMVPDGCSQSVQTAARWYKQYVMADPEPLALDRMGSTGMVKTHMANSVITGSAAAATAFATGYKTTVRFLSVGPDPAKAPNLTGFGSPITPYAPIMTVLEGAKKKGKATGLISTSRITHATPAAYACHIDDRGKDNEIMEHLVYQDIDLVFGGGKRHLIPTDLGGKRTDGENLQQVLLDRGYQFVETAGELGTIQHGRVWGMFASSHMEADIDRATFAPEQPSIAQMTEKAIDLLSRNRNGFFLMVEGSQVDWAGHANDPIYMITDFLAFDAAVAKAMAYADRNPNTLVVVFPDHDTGALSIGHEQSDGVPHYTHTTIEDLVDPLRGMTMSATGVDRKIIASGGYSTENVQNALSTWWGLDIDPDHAWEIVNLVVSDGMYGNSAIGEVVSKHYTVFGWTSHGHTAEDVPLWSYGRKRPVGLFDNTEMAEIVATAFNFSLMGSGFWQEYPDSVLDTTDLDQNPVATINGIEYPVGKDLMIVDGEAKDMTGITVYAPEAGKVYIPIR